MLAACAAQTLDEYIDILAEVLTQFATYTAYVDAFNRVATGGGSRMVAYVRIIETLSAFKSLLKEPNEKTNVGTDLSWMD